MKYPLRFVVGYVQPVTHAAVRIKDCLKSTSAIKIAAMKNTDDFRFEGKPSRARAKSTPFPISKDEWDTKEDTGKSMKNALYVLQYAKRHLSGRSDVEQRKNQARSLSRYRVMLVQEGVTPISTVLRSATAVKAGQDRFSILIVDFHRIFVLTMDLVPFIFAIFSCTTYSRNFDRAGKTV